MKPKSNDLSFFRYPPNDIKKKNIIDLVDNLLFTRLFVFYTIILVFCLILFLLCVYFEEYSFDFINRWIEMQNTFFI